MLISSIISSQKGNKIQFIEIIIFVNMKGKLKGSREEEYLPTTYTYDSIESAVVNRPLKSPSPDKKSANIIVSTRSPDIHQLKRSATPTREEVAGIRASQRSEVREKNFQLIITPGQRKQIATFKNVEATAFRTADSGSQRREEHPSPNNSRARNIKIQIAAQDQLEVRHSGSRYRSEFRGELSQLDYLRILKTKEETISQLKDYIGSIETRAPEDSLVRNYESRISALNSEVKELKIENQHLFNAMEKEKERARSANSSRERQEIIHREIRELRESLRIREGEGEELARRLQKQRQERREIQQQNERLLRLLKDRGLREHPQQRKQQNTSLSGSSLSQQRSNSDKDRLSLIKIKELHQENLKIAKESFYLQLRAVQQNFMAQMDDLHAHVEHLNSRISQLEISKKHAQGKLASREQAHRESERHQEIETVLLDKHSNNERLLQEQRRENEELKKQNQRLSNDLTATRKEIEELHAKSLTYSREMSYLPQQEQQLIENLRKDNATLTNAVQKLQKELTDAELQLDAAAQTAREQEHKLVVIMDTYQTKIKEERTQREQREQQLKEMQEKEKAEIEQQLKDALKLYDKENSGLKQSLLQKNNEIANLNEQLQKLKADLHQHRLNNRRDSQDLTALTEENKQLKNHNLVLQKNVDILTEQLQEAANRQSSLNNRNTETESCLKQVQKLNESLKNYVNSLQEERERLNRALKQAQCKINENQQAQVEVLGRFRTQLDAKQAETTLINSKLMTSCHRIDQLQREKSQLRATVQSLKAQRSSINFATMQQELKELRAMITDYYNKNKNRLDNEIVQDYFRLVHTHELKIDENLKLAKEIDQLRGQLAADNREKLLLSEKISLLQSNIAIYQRQLRERKQLYEQVLQQKVRIQKEALLSKRIKTEQANIVEGFRSSTSEITSKIDRLVDFQRERYRQLRALVEQQNASV